MVKIETEEQLESLLENGDHLYVLDFYADWCGPCKKMAPLLEEIHQENEGLDVLKINIEDHPNLAQEFKVQSIPTLFFVIDSEVEEVVLGARSKQDVLEIINELI